MNMYWFSCKVLAILVMYLIILEFFQEIFEKNSSISFKKICPVGAQFRAGGWTDMKDLIVAFHNFANTKGAS